MRKNVRLITVVIVAVAMIVCALLILRDLDREIVDLQADVKEAELALRMEENTLGQRQTEITNMDKDSYIIARARELGYMMPGEIRFVVVNPEVLEENPDEAIVEERTGP